MEAMVRMRGINSLRFLLILSLCKDSIAAAVTQTKPTPTEPFGNVWQLDVHGNYWLYWKTNSTHITFETHVKTKGYVGFGLSNNGKMFPSDVVVGWVDSQGSTHFKDCHTEGHYAPIVDKSQDWFLLLGQEDNFGTVLKFTRKLDTCDDKDFHITDNTIKVIYAYHPDDPASFDALSWHGADRRGAKSLMLLSSVKANEYVPPPDAEIFELRHNNFHIPAADTEYHCRVFKVPDRPNKYHMIRYEPIITPGNENHVHHILVYSCPSATDSDVGHEYSCYKHKPRNLHCQDTIIAWAIGGVAFDFPANAGFSFNTPGDPRYLVMETHYNNPTIQSGLIDSSGIRIIATTKTRQFDAGLLMTGALVNELQFVPPFEPNFLSRHYCSKKCLQKAMKTPDNPMKVFAVLLHSHLLGISLKARHIRGDTELEPLAEDTTYDFDYQDFRIFPKEREIRYGDQVTVDCFYDSSQRTKPTLGGLSTSEEMCLAFLYYYPKTDISKCQSEALFHQLSFDASKNIRMMYSWNWNDQSVRDRFHGLLANSTYYHECHGETSHGNPNWSEDVYHEQEPTTLYTAPSSQCPVH